MRNSYGAVFYTKRGQRRNVQRIHRMLKQRKLNRDRLLASWRARGYTVHTLRGKAVAKGMRAMHIHDGIHIIVNPHKHYPVILLTAIFAVPDNEEDAIWFKLATK
jgi:hypothetical protein